MFSGKTQWDGHIIDIKTDDRNKKFIGTIKNILGRRVSFSGHDFDELKEAYVVALQKCCESPESFPKTTFEEQVVADYHKPSLFRNILSPKEIEPLQQFKFKTGNDPKSTHANLRHPLWVLIEAYEQNKNNENTIAIACNTEKCLELCLQFQPTFPDSLKGRLFDCNDYTHSLSALAEIRAFGSLCSTSLVPIAIHDPKDKSADFEMTVGTAKCLIEVHSKFSSPEDERQFSVEEMLGKQEGCVRIERISSVTPFGQPNESKPDDGVTTNMISKICAMKQDELQFEDDTINILWIDLQDSESVKFPVEADHCLPCFTHTMGYQDYCVPFSGCIWHAFYGHKGDFVTECVGEGFTFHQMRHNGRFIQSSKVNFSVISLPHSLVVFENPSRKSMAEQDIVRELFYRMPLFSAQHSILDTSPRIIESIISIQRAQRDYCFKSITKGLPHTDID